MRCLCVLISALEKLFKVGEGLGKCWGWTWNIRRKGGYRRPKIIKKKVLKSKQYSKW